MPFSLRKSYRVPRNQRRARTTFVVMLDVSGGSPSDGTKRRVTMLTNIVTRWRDNCGSLETFVRIAKKFISTSNVGFLAMGGEKKRDNSRESHADCFASEASLLQRRQLNP